MNDYEDLDDYSSGNSFRARSNTWPLNKPDFAVPSSGANIDETLPEIELEDDDLFTTNENWSTGVIDHDIMSWDPILNAQNQHHQQQQQQQALNQPSIVHHHHQHHHQQPQPQPNAQHQGQQLTKPLTPPQAPQGHPRQQSVHVQDHLHRQTQSNHHQHLNHRHQDPSQHIHQHHRSEHQHQPIHQQQTQHHNPQHHHHHHHHQHPNHQLTQQNESFLDGVNTSSVMVAPQNAHLQNPQPHLQHQTSPQPSHHQHIQHQTLNSVHCLDPEDSNEYHLQQLHHLHLDNNPLPSINDAPQDHFAPTLASLCTHNPTGNIRNDSYNISPDPSHHQLQQLTSARYDMDPNVAEYDLKDSHVDPLDPHGHHHLDDQPHLHDQQVIHHHNHQHQEHQSHHHQQHIHHHMTSSSLDNHTGGSHMLSSSLSTSGIGLSGDLEDLDYKHNVDSVNFLQNSDEPPTLLQDQQQQSEIHQQSSDSVANDTKQSNSTSTTKATKQNVPRRNAWGNMSYADLISQAINSTSDKRLTLSQIYDWMVQHVPYFKDKGDSNSSAGWKNSVRHNLSLHSRFKRLQNEGTGKSSWWTINPEANVGKCARRRAASMEASKYEKKRGRAKKKAEAIRQGLVSYPSLTNPSLNHSTSTLEQQQAETQSTSQFHSGSIKSEPQAGQAQSEEPQLQSLDQFVNQKQLQQPPPHQPELHIQTLDQYGSDQPSQQQQQQLQQLQQSDARSCEELNAAVQPAKQNQFVVTAQQQQVPQPQHHQEQPHYEENNESNKIQQQQQSQYYYQFELSTAL